MSEPGRRVILLTGAPLPSTLSWEEAELSAPLQPCFLCPRKHIVSSTATHDDLAPLWRSLPVEQPHLPTGLTQASREDVFLGRSGQIAVETSFLTTTEFSFVSSPGDHGQTQTSLVSDSDREEAISQYYEHSFAIHEDIPSSQIVAHASFSDESVITNPEASSFEHTINTGVGLEAQNARSRLASSYLSDLKDVPNATYLQSITPQTMTVNLVVGLISVPEPRIIKTRKGGRSVELVEIILGDDTRAGFGINIWLPLSQATKLSGPRDSDLRSETLQLRPRDIVLIRNAALSSFKGKVYGQSLRKGMTTLDLLYRTTVDEDDKRGAYEARDFDETVSQDLNILKLTKVKDWVMHFVGGDPGLPAPRSGSRTTRPTKGRHLENLPLDTP
ncbi:hypothetical protein MMC28_004350 [Mycoblastus sanguinarius]|nr:hypothetical protein [Mycoblastus sanguinarius]